ncbi:MAG: zf-HC2 domain-containing protein [Verrucomicrobiia bacterium]
MDCRKTQRLFDEFAEGRLALPLAEQLQRHLIDCTDCRVAQQRAARLRRLLTLKRYEQPAPAYFHGFLDEFHRRLQAETTSPASLWMRLKAQWEGFRATTSDWALNYGLAGAAGVLLVAGVVSWMAVHQTIPMVAERGTPIASQNVVASISPTGSALRIASEGGATARMEGSAPRYILDHIAITPVSYEGPRVDF